jgi:hypothetical protein
MKKVMFSLLLSALVVAQSASAQAPTSAQDPNVPTSAGAHGAPMREWTPTTEQALEMAKWVSGRTMTDHADSDPNLCAIVVVPGPPNSFDISFGIFNVAVDSLDFLIMDSFPALQGQSLLHESVFNTVVPPSGTLTVLYPLAGC